VCLFFKKTKKMLKANEIVPYYNGISSEINKKYSDHTSLVISDVMWNLANIIQANIDREKYVDQFNLVANFLERKKVEEVESLIKKVEVTYYTWTKLIRKRLMNLLLSLPENEK